MGEPGRTRARPTPRRRSRSHRPEESGEGSGYGVPLAVADAGTRERTVQDLQRQSGNEQVSRLLRSSVQREPAAPTVDAVSGAGRIVRPDLPSMAPRVAPDPRVAVHAVEAAMRGHAYSGTMPTVSAEDKTVITETNYYFESSPREIWEDRTDDDVRHRDALTDRFQRKAYELALYTLQQSENQAFDEVGRYKDSPDKAGEAEDLRTAAGHLAEVQRAVLLCVYPPGILADRPGLVKDVDDLVDLPAENFHLSEESVPIWQSTVAKYKALRDIYGQRFPVLMGRNQDMAVLARSKGSETEDYADDQAFQVLHNIDDARDQLTEEKIWSLGPVMAATKQLMGISEGTGANDAIDDKLDQIATDAMFHKLAMAALQIGLQVLAASLTGGLSLVVQGAVVGMAAANVANDYDEYKSGKALSGRVSLDEAQRLSTQEPSLLWLALDIAGMVVDSAMLGVSFRNLLAPVKALGEGAQAARSAMSLAEVEDVVRAQGRMLEQEGKLAEGLTVDLFTERIMASIHRRVATVGEIAEHQAGVLGSVIEGSHPSLNALVAGNREALISLLAEHGDWKTLIRGLERGGATDIAENLGALRKSAFDDLRRHLKEVSEGKADVEVLGGASEETISDIDGQVTGPDGGRMMIEAEGYMTAKYGESWSGMFRMNFYTEGSRLTRYQKVLEGLSAGEQLAITERVTAVAEKFTFARMLEHAGDDAAAVARVENLALNMNVDLSEARQVLAEGGEAAGLLRRNQLLTDIDGLEAQYEAASGHARVDLAEMISTKQMEANFYTFEANIGPGSLKMSGIRALRPLEAYQSALTHLEMVDHIISEAGGDVARASREYELFKYIGRFTEAAGKGGVETKALTYLGNQAKAVSGGTRELMEEGAHEFVDATKVGARGPTLKDLPQATGATPPITDEFLVKQYEMFREVAVPTLRNLHPEGAMGP